MRNYQIRPLTAVALAFTLLFTVGWDSCEKKDQTPEETKAQILMWAQIGVDTAREVLPSFAEAGRNTAKVDEWLAISQKAITAIRNNDGRAITYITDSIKIVKDVIAEGQLIKDPNKRMIAVLALVAAQVALQNVAANLPNEALKAADELAAADSGDVKQSAIRKRKPSEILRAFAKERKPQCKRADNGRFASMDYCRANPLTTMVVTY